MTEVLYLMGKSSSGKDTVKNKLVEALIDNNASVKELVIYTTREIRAGELNGVDYNFVTEDIYQQLVNENKIIEARTYHKVQGTVRYFTVFDENFMEEKVDYVIGVGTLESYNKLLEYFKGTNYKELSIKPIYLDVENGVRLLRAIRRELKEDKEKQNFEEVCRRFDADEEDYSQEKIKESGIVKIFLNDNIENTVKEIINYYKL